MLLIIKLHLSICYKAHLLSVRTVNFRQPEMFESMTTSHGTATPMAQSYQVIYASLVLSARGKPGEVAKYRIFLYLITASAKIIVFCGRIKILRCEQNFWYDSFGKTHELLFALLCSVAISKNLKWFCGAPHDWMLTFS
jgi:hypothetical protein